MAAQAELSNLNLIHLVILICILSPLDAAKQRSEIALGRYTSTRQKILERSISIPFISLS